MVRIPVRYPNEPGKRFDHTGMLRDEVDEGLAGGGAAPAPFVAAADTDLAPQMQVSEIVVAWVGPVAG